MQARWTGLVYPSASEVYTFYMGGPPAATTKQERVKLWVDKSILVSQWTSLASTSPSGTIGFGRGNGYYDVMALYKCSVPGGGGSCAYGLYWQSTTTGVAATDTH